MHSFGKVEFPDCTDPARLLALTRRALDDAVQPKVSYEVDVAALSGGDDELGDTVVVIGTSRDPEWRLKTRVVRRVRTFSDGVLARVTIGTVQPVDYARTAALAADVAALQDDVAGIDGNLSAAVSADAVESAVAGAVSELEDLSTIGF